jgi:aromatic ring-opening dioxygenase LigB subunit
VGLVFACIAPHGDLAIPEACAPDQGGLARATQAAMAELGRRSHAAGAETVVVMTPHGIHVDEHFAVVTAGRAAGALEGSADVALDMPVDRPLAGAILGALDAAGLPSVGVSYGGNVPTEAVFPMDWGTLIPLWYLGGRADPPVSVVVIAPARDLTAAQHEAAGVAIGEAIEASGRGITLVASADQAHTHRPDGPYGFSADAALHDERVVAVVRDGRLDLLRELGPELIESAKPDSWWQMLMLHGALGDRWASELLAYEAPTYYGMLSAAFAPTTP